MKTRRIFLLSFCFALTSCAFAPGPETEMLTPVTSGTSFRVVAPLQTLPIHFSSGTYTPDVANSLGTFYRGPRYCVVMEAGKDWVAYDGGIWVPASPGVAPRVYTYIGEPLRFKDLQSALALNEPAAASGGSAVPALVANPSLSPSGMIATGVVGGVVEALILESQKRDAGKVSWVISRGAPLAIQSDAFKRAVEWSGNPHKP